MNRKLSFCIGIFFLLIAMAEMILWIVVSANEMISFEATVKEYISYFPSTFANPITLTLLNILSLGIAIICFVFSINWGSNSKFRKIYYALIIFCGFLAFWNLFSLM